MYQIDDYSPTHLIHYLYYSKTYIGPEYIIIAHFDSIYAFFAYIKY